MGRRSRAVTALAVAMLMAVSCGLPGTPSERTDGTADEPGVTNPQLDPATATEPTAAPSPDDPRPNVVMMLVDDMRADDLAYMPKTRRLLGRQGVSFPNAISVNPLCCPARASLITAQYSHNNGVYANGGAFGGQQALRRPDNTLPVWLQRAGYNTAYFGKYMNGYGNANTSPIPPGWDWWDATGNGVYRYTSFQFANNGEPENFFDDYVTTRLRERSDDAIRSFAETREETGEPFFVFDSYVAPHSSRRPVPEMEARFGNNPIPEPKHYRTRLNVKAPSLSKPSFNQRIRNQADTGGIGAFKKRSRANIQRAFTLRIQSLASVDDAVQKTVQTLKETGQYDDTVLMFASDNGFLLGEHGKYAKITPQKESVRVPLVIAGPGFRGGQQSARWATTPDIAATIAGLADARPEMVVDGTTLEGASRRDANPRTGLLIESGNERATNRRSVRYNYQGLLMGTRYTYARWRTSGNSEELYDNRRGPLQMVNRAQDPRYRAVVEAARSELRKIGDCRGVGNCETTRTQWPSPKAVPQRRR